MFGLQPAHIVIIVFVAILLFVPSRLPMLGRGMRKMVSEFRREISAKPNEHATKPSHSQDVGPANKKE
ncbi:MAG: twin-arginine translocase TatA/TatE family subunit [Chloroflexi bacterium]|nr:twin-arginine translocase TatA/TatE family subunit [Chloroflexota bacterium]